MSVGQEDLLFQSSANGSSSGGANTSIAYSNAKGAFFPNIADVDRLAGGQIFRKWYLWNDSPTDALISPSIWIQSEPRYMTELLGLGADSSTDSDATQGNMTGWSTDAVVSVKSSSSDTRTATVCGLGTTGDPLVEDLVLTGTTEVLSLAQFSVVYGVSLSAVDGGLTVTVREGSGGTVRGTIGLSKKCCWLWVDAFSKGSGIHLPDLPSLTGYPIWDWLSWTPAISGVRPNNSVIAVEEN